MFISRLVLRTYLETSAQTNWIKVVTLVADCSSISPPVHSPIAGREDAYIKGKMDVEQHSAHQIDACIRMHAARFTAVKYIYAAFRTMCVPNTNHVERRR